MNRQAHPPFFVNGPPRGAIFHTAVQPALTSSLCPRSSLQRRNIERLLGAPCRVWDHGRARAVAFARACYMRASERWHPPRPWRSEEEALMVRRLVLWWLTCRDRSKPSGRAWAGSSVSATPHATDGRARAVAFARACYK